MAKRNREQAAQAQALLQGLGESLAGLKKGLERRRAREQVGPDVSGKPETPENALRLGVENDQAADQTLLGASENVASPDGVPKPAQVESKEPEESATFQATQVPLLEPEVTLADESLFHGALNTDRAKSTDFLHVEPVSLGEHATEQAPLKAGPETDHSASAETSAWLADLDLDAIDNEAARLETSPEEEELEDRLDGELAETVREETDELVPAIEATLASIGQGAPGMVADLHRLVHTLKGVAGMAGAMRTRALIHRMESLMEEVGDGRTLDAALLARLEDMFARVRQQLDSLFAAPLSQEGSQAPEAPQAPKTVRIHAELVDRLFNEINEARLAGTALGGNHASMRRKLREMDENIDRVSKMARDLEMQAETQIQSRRAQLAENNEEFDPLEFDRFTVLQELSRLLTEAVSDVQDLQRDLTRAMSEQETHLAYQERSIFEVQEGLHKTRLVSVDTTINDRLHKVALATAKELGKSVVFGLSGGRVALDRALLEKIVSPLEHLLRNAVAHGIESAEQRRQAGKAPAGQLRVAVQQEAGRVMFVVEDDGAGLNVKRIREKAVEKGLWPAETPLDDRQAADLICLPGFSTSEHVTQIAGRGVGMDVVRSEVLSMGGRFDLASRPGRGLRVAIQLPTTVAAAAVLVVEAGGETWSVPTETVDDVRMIRDEQLESARKAGRLTLDGHAMPFAHLASLMGVMDPAALPQRSAPVLLLREGDRRVAVETDRLRQVAEVSLRPLGRLWANSAGIVGSTLLPDGRATFLVDPLRAPWEASGSSSFQAPQTSSSQLVRPPLVLVVDDSITVRKVTARFLERNGFEPVLAKDGQEALEILAQVQPAAMLLDVEMPRMDGFDCAKSVRENPRYKELPILMITSRTAEKHRDRAMSLGVDEYLGKPFREDELLERLQSYLRHGRRPAQPR